MPQPELDRSLLAEVLAPKDPRNPVVKVHQRAEANESVLLAEGYGRARTRVSHYALVYYNVRGADVPYIASLRYFVRLPAVERVHHMLRVAITTLKEARPNGKLLVTSSQWGDTWHDYAIPPSALAGRMEKVVLIEPGMAGNCSFPTFT